MKMMKEINQLTNKLERKLTLLKPIYGIVVEKFQTQMATKIQVVITKTLKEWVEQVVELQVLRVDEAN
jgi:hypothetical protein